MLYARQNKEYINEDELAKKIVFERTISQVNKYYGDQKEVAMKPGQLSSQLKYGFDSLFEGWRNSIEQVLNASYNDDITTQKTYEVIKKYNQLSSYLKNVVNMKQLSEDDVALIQKSFDDMSEKLELLKQLAIDNNFIDKEDIIDMVNKINKTIAVPKLELDKVAATLTGMTQQIKDKNASVKMIQDALDKIYNIEDFLNTDPTMQQSTKKATLEADAKALKDIFEDNELNPLEFAYIQKNYDDVISLEKDIEGDVKWFNDIKTTLKQNFDELNKLQNANKLPSFDEKTIENLLDEKVTKVAGDEIKDLETKWKGESDAFRADPQNQSDYKDDTDAVLNFWETFLLRVKPVVIKDIKDEIDKFYNKGQPMGFEADINSTETAKNNLDVLDDTQLVKEEQDLVKLINKVNKQEIRIKDDIEKKIDAAIANEIAAAKKTVAIPQPANIPRKKLPKVKTAAKPVKIVVAPKSQAGIYENKTEFIDKFRIAAAKNKKQTQVFKNFKAKSASDKMIDKAWANYITLNDADKKAYFT